MGWFEPFYQNGDPYKFKFKMLNGEFAGATQTNASSAAAGRSNWLGHSPMLHNQGVKQSLKKLGMRYAKLRRIVDGVGVMVAALDFNGVIRFATPSSKKVTGFSPGDIVGNHISRFIHHDDLDEFEKWLAPWAVLDRRMHQARFRFLHADNSWRWLSIVSCKLAQRPEINGAILTLNDVTSTKFAEEELAKAREESEHNVEIRARFMSIMAHDLRSPLTAIHGLMKLLANKPEGAGRHGDKRDEIIERVTRSVEHMINLTDDILSINRFVRGKFEPRFAPVNCAESADSVIGRLRNLADIKGVFVENRLGSGMWLIADKTLLEEALGNLLTNAIKFCGDGDRVEIFDPPGRPGLIAVKDTGAGVDPLIIGDLFKEDVKTSTNGTAGERGTGLGLPLCKEIMDMHGGSIFVESAPGQGSAFYLDFPLCRIVSAA